MCCLRCENGVGPKGLLHGEVCQLSPNLQCTCLTLQAATVMRITRATISVVISFAKCTPQVFRKHYCSPAPMIHHLQLS